MKQLRILYAVILLMSFSAYSQKNYMNNIVEKACECVSEIPDGEDLTGENFGICIIEEAALYKEELLRDHNIDMLNIDRDGEQLGRMVAIEMMTTCPEQMKRIAASTNEEATEETTEEDSYYVVEGKIKSIIKNDFIIFSVTDDTGKTSKFYWLTFIKSENDLQNEFESFEGKKVTIEYSTVELYDPKLEEYRNYNMIESFNTTD